MNTGAKLLRPPIQEVKPTAETLMHLCIATGHLQAAQSRLISLLRATHDRRFLSEATQLSEACAEELEAARQGLVGFDDAPAATQPKNMILLPRQEA
jgi:hypothetical protein